MGNWKIKNMKIKKKYRICIYDATNQFFFQKKIMNALQKIKINKEEIFLEPHPNQSYCDSEKNWLWLWRFAKKYSTF